MINFGNFEWALQMFGTSLYGIFDTRYCNQYKHIVEKCVKYDMNDFLHLECVYDGPAPTQLEPDSAEATPAVRRSRKRPSSPIEVEVVLDRSGRAARASPEDTPMVSSPFEAGDADCTPLPRALSTSSEHQEEDAELVLDPYGSNVDFDLGLLRNNGTGPSRVHAEIRSPSPSHGSPEAMEHVFETSTEVLVSRIPSTPVESLAVQLSSHPVSPRTIGTPFEENSRILLSDSSDDEDKLNHVPPH